MFMHHTFKITTKYKEISHRTFFYSRADGIVKVAQSCLTLCDHMDYKVHGILQARILKWVAFPFSRESSQPRDQTQVFCIEGRFFTSWTTREDQEYRSGSLSLLQRIFPTQESTRGLLHCTWILYQLSYERSPAISRLLMYRTKR